MAGIYIHIPFCKQACNYCDFHFRTSLHNKPQMVEAICKEIELRKDYLGTNEIETIYFGGGTPSLLEPDEIDKIFDTIFKHFNLKDKNEVTVEANPDDLNKEKLDYLEKSIVNRLSIGVQSFHDTELQFLNRAHTAKEALESIHQAKSHGFDNITIDLIYGIKDETDKSWNANLDKAFELDIPHLSCYALTIEQGTVFGNWVKKKHMPTPNDDFQARQFEILVQRAEKEGYQQYEISNFAKHGKYAMHNTNYWREEKYLGIGPGAHSYKANSRKANASNNTLYIKELNEGKVPAEVEQLTREDKVNEYIMTSLRTMWGCDLAYLQKEYNVDIKEQYKETLSDFEKSGLLEIKEDKLYLTKAGKLLSDTIVESLMVETK